MGHLPSDKTSKTICEHRLISGGIIAKESVADLRKSENAQCKLTLRVCTPSSSSSSSSVWQKLIV